MAVGACAASPGGSASGDDPPAADPVDLATLPEPAPAIAPSGAQPPLVRARPVRLGPDPSPPLATDPDDLPMWLVTADGWLLTPDRRGDGPSAAIVPARRLDDAALGELRRRLEAAGLHVPPGAAEQPADEVRGTEIAVEDATRGWPLAVHRVVRATPAQAAVLDALADPGELSSSLDATTHGFRPASFRIMAEPAPSGGAAHPWMADEVVLAVAGGCTVVAGDAAAALGEELRTHPDRLRDFRGRWRQGGVDFDVSVRPVLPGERGCPDLPR